mgnify:CR=1 FL=1
MEIVKKYLTLTVTIISLIVLAIFHEKKTADDSEKDEKKYEYEKMEKEIEKCIYTNHIY